MKRKNITIFWMPNPDTLLLQTLMNPWFKQPVNIWHSFFRAPMINFFWCCYRWFITSLALEKCKKECNMREIIVLVQDFCPLKIKITQCPGGFCLIYLLLCKDFVKFDLIRSVLVACENICFSSLFAAGDVSRGGTSATQRQKFHTDDVKSVQNPVRSADWSTE